MNYRHGFHAGNFADCMKHALLVWLLEAMARKPAPFLVLDTHAGAGAYDLAAEAAQRTGEWRGGIGRLQQNARAGLGGADRGEAGAGGPGIGGTGIGGTGVGEAGPDGSALRPYLAAIARAAPPGTYPGSPVLIRTLLRPQDRLICCELHPGEHATLRARLGADPRVALHRRDGYAALRAFLPPPERRALVLLDPPFEAPDEFERLAAAIAVARARFVPAVLAAWYPVKGRAPVRLFHDRLRAAGLRDLVAAELWLREPTDPARLNGCGLLVASPPWRFEAEVPAILDALLAGLGGGPRTGPGTGPGTGMDGGEPGAGTAVLRLTAE